MEFKEIQEKVIQCGADYSQKHNITIDDDFALLKLHEEMGELTQAYLIHKKKSRPSKHVSEELSKQELSKELADVVGLSMILANTLNIDLEEALDKKWLK